jgi:Kdo2-lipid IVA lauroyltransferase/acyltransferase
MERILQYLTYSVLRALLFITQLIPFGVAMTCARFIGRVLFYVLGDRRKLAIQNLQEAFKSEKSDAEIKQLARKSFEHLGMVALEFTRIPKVIRNFDQYVRSEGVEKVKEALKAGQGVLLLGAHLGNWEWMAIRLAADQIPVHAIARPLRNPFVYKFVTNIRQSTGLGLVSKYGASRETRTLLKNNQVVAILMDQHERQGAVWIQFFGREASTTTLPARLALRCNPTIFPITFLRSKKGPARFVYGNPIPIKQTGDFKKDLFENTQLQMQVLEHEIRKQPEYWLWMHKRWRSPATLPLTQVKMLPKEAGSTHGRKDRK